MVCTVNLFATLRQIWASDCLRIDEEEKRVWTVVRTATDAMESCKQILWMVA
jgi:hypothetical protein